MKIKKTVKKAAGKLGIDTIRISQAAPIESILEGKDTFVVAPTGFGKSAIGHIPAVIHEGQLTLIIEPTISLMHDQVQKLKSHGISAEYIDSSLSSTEANKILCAVGRGKINILYVAPERLKSWEFQCAMRAISVYLIIIDECHCVLEWGGSFRPSYQEIASFINSLKDRPVIAAMTATVKPKDRKKIQKQLGMKDMNGSNARYATPI